MKRKVISMLLCATMAASMELWSHLPQQTALR